MNTSFCFENNFLFVFSQAHPKFRRAEFESICLLFGIQPAPNFYPEESHYQVLHFDGGEVAVQNILSRSVLLKDAFRILINAPSHEILLERLNTSGVSILQSFNDPKQSWCLQFRSQWRKNDSKYIQSLIQRYDHSMGLMAPIDLKNARNRFTIFELGDEMNKEPDEIIFTKFVGPGQTHLKNKFTLMSRVYIGNSTMDPELAFIQANLVLSRPGSLMLDPFCGTGGILLSAAYFFSYVLGVEIKWDVAKAKGKSSRVGQVFLGNDQSIQANFAQYGLDDGRFLGVILADSSKHKMWRQFGFLDSILADPPYGIRERGQKLGIAQIERKQLKTIDSFYELSSHQNNTLEKIKGENSSKDNQEIQLYKSFPEKQRYKISSVFLDLMDLGIRLLRVGGRLAFWFPVCRSEYSEKILPKADCLRLLYNCEQQLQKNTSRRLLVYEKIKISKISEKGELIEKAYVLDNCYNEQSFREKIFKS